MALLLVLLVLALPVAELAVLVRVAQAIGVLDAVALLLGISLVGLWLTRRAGLGALTRIRRTQDTGQLPSREMADGSLKVAAGVLLMVPGFITDALGLALFLPPIRAGVRGLVSHRLRRHGQLVVHHQRQTANGTDGIWDVESWEEQSPPQHRGERWPGGELGGPQ